VRLRNGAGVIDSDSAGNLDVRAGTVGCQRRYNRSMSSDRHRLQSLVDALSDSEVQVAISFLAELGEQEIIDVETAAKLDLARAEPGDDVPLEEVRRRLGL
jgi:hypothetical protein